MKLIYQILIWSLVFLMLTSLLSFAYYSINMDNGFKIGFPFVYYNEFKVSGNEYNNFSWFLNNAIYNVVICILFSVLFVSRKKLFGNTKSR